MQSVAYTSIIFDFILAFCGAFCYAASAFLRKERDALRLPRNSFTEHLEKHQAVGSLNLSSKDKRHLLSECWFALCDKEEYHSGLSDTDGAPVVVDLLEAAVPWPADFHALIDAALRLGPFRYRLDVCDTRAKWCSGKRLLCLCSSIRGR